MNEFDNAYKNELALIQANGGDYDALKFRYDELKRQRLDLLEMLAEKSFEFAGREKALNEYVHKLRKD